MSNNLNVVELFAGGGGSVAGFEKCGFKHVALFEIDSDAIDTLKTNLGDDDCCKIHNIDVTKISNFKSYINQDNQVDILIGGFPCQAFSFAGKRLGFEDTRGTLFHELARAAKDLNPKIIVCENVKGLVKHDNGKTLTIIRNTFEELGYTIFQKVLNANDYEVAQKRERLILVCVRNDIYKEKGKYQFPKPIVPRLVINDVFSNVPKSNEIKYNDTKYNIMKNIPMGGNWKDLDINVAKDYMGKSYYSGGGKTGIAKRLDLYKPSPTILTSPAQKQTERCHPTETRPLTIRESARLQSFDDNWQFKGSISSQYKQIGNAIPVNLAYHIGISIENYLT